jgi:prepilin-type N-terminal cleavage/methylation domain-containing protein
VLLCAPKFFAKKAARLRRAFTLVELLIVIGLIALLLGAVGLSLSGPGVTTLATAQNTLAGLVATARAQAAVKQTEARILIYGTRPPSGDSEKFLRYLRIVTADTPGATGAGARWTPVGSPVSLPSGICIVPTTTSGLLATGVIWPANPAPVSTFLAAAPARYTIAGDPATSAADTYYALQFTPDGVVTPVAAKLAVATTTVSNGLPQFTNAGAVRGLAFRTSGAVTRVNEPGSF